MATIKPRDYTLDRPPLSSLPSLPVKGEPDLLLA
jgi:hypothetical protein